MLILYIQLDSFQLFYDFYFIWLVCVILGYWGNLSSDLLIIDWIHCVRLRPLDSLGSIAAVGDYSYPMVLDDRKTWSYGLGTSLPVSCHPVWLCVLWLTSWRSSLLLLLSSTHARSHSHSFAYRATNLLVVGSNQCDTCVCWICFQRQTPFRHMMQVWLVPSSDKFTLTG